MASFSGFARIAILEFCDFGTVLGKFSWRWGLQEGAVPECRGFGTLLGKFIWQWGPPGDSAVHNWLYLGAILLRFSPTRGFRPRVVAIWRWGPPGGRRSQGS